MGFELKLVEANNKSDVALIRKYFRKHHDKASIARLLAEGALFIGLLHREPVCGVQIEVGELSIMANDPKSQAVIEMALVEIERIAREWGASHMCAYTYHIRNRKAYDAALEAKGWEGLDGHFDKILDRAKFDQEDAMIANSQWNIFDQ